MAVQILFKQGLAPATNRSYTSARNFCIKFCSKAGLSPLPLTQSNLCLFAAFLSQQKLAPRSISLYISAVRHMEVQASTTTSSRSEWPYLQYVLKGVKRSASNSSSLQWLPITLEIMHLLKMSWVDSKEPHPYLHTLLWAAACLAFFGFLRMGEVTSSPESPPTILASGLAIDSHTNPTMIKVVLGRTKTDQFNRGTAIYIGKTGSDICPVRAILQYLATRPTPRQGPLFVHQDESPLTRAQFVHLLKEALAMRGVDHKRYTGHSFRIGAATTAAQSEVPDHLIKALGRWKSEAYQIYIQTPPATLAAVSSSLVSGSLPLQ